VAYLRIHLIVCPPRLYRTRLFPYTTLFRSGLTLTDVERPVTTGVFDTIAARTPSKRLSTAEDVASLIVFLGSAANRNVTGEIVRSEEHTSELQSRENLVCRLLHEKKK